MEHAEQDLYLKTSALVNVISNIQKTNNFTSVPTALEEVYITMFERGFIEVDDVILGQLWIQALIEAGYEFPKFQQRAKSDLKLNFVTLCQSYLIAADFRFSLSSTSPRKR